MMRGMEMFSFESGNNLLKTMKSYDKINLRPELIFINANNEILV